MKYILNNERYSGILLHPTSLNGKYGIGSLGNEAYQFVDWLARNGQKLWQILPLGPTDWSHSPYQCYSAFAGNSDLIDLELLVADKLLLNSDLTVEKPFSHSKIEYKKVKDFRQPLLKKAFQQFVENKGFDAHDYHFFWDLHSWWLESWSLFFACRQNLPNNNWSFWEKSLVNRNEKTLQEYYYKFEQGVLFQRFLQFTFFKQWFALKKYANEKGVKIFGDIPLYVSYDSSDVWANQDIFLLDENRKPTLVGGVPPDYFSETGQLWGNPLFDWHRLRQRDYDWWVARIHFNLSMFDLVRIDHFRGLESFWAVPATETTAINGTWMKADGDSILQILQNQIGHLPIIAEDLGTITDDVHALRQKYNLHGMKVLQFAFADEATNEHLPHNHRPDFAVYTGTHDNDTTTGWLQSITKIENENLSKYLNNNEITSWDIVRLALSSVAQIAIVPMQDILELDTKSRTNTPGTVKNNWVWRMPPNSLSTKKSSKLLELTKNYGR